MISHDPTSTHYCLPCSTTSGWCWLKISLELACATATGVECHGCDRLSLFSAVLLHPFCVSNEYTAAVGHNGWPPCFHLNPSLFVMLSLSLSFGAG